MGFHFTLVPWLHLGYKCGYMPELLCNVPLVSCLLRDEYQFNFEAGWRSYTPCAIVSVSSIQGRPMLFQCLTNQGVLRDHLPVTAFCHKEVALGDESAHRRALDRLNLWSCFSEKVACLSIEYLKNLRCRVLFKDRSTGPGTYLFTFDWWGTPMSEDPGESAHKSGHFISLDDGNYTIQPNNRIQWFEPSFVTRPFSWNERPGFKVNTRQWLTERSTKMHTENTDSYWCEWEETK